VSLTKLENDEKVSPTVGDLSGVKNIKVAIIDLYNGIANQGMRGFQEILDRYRTKHNLNLTYQVFDTRGNNEIPGTDFDIYICSGGPGDPLISEVEPWDIGFMQLMDKLEAHNNSNALQKKHVLFVCHSFQLMCRKYKLGLINKRRSASFGILPVHLTRAGKNEPVLENLSDPFYTVDSRSWQVIHPDEKRFTELGMQLLVIEKERPYVDLPRAMMAIRFNEYFIGTQFHPEADAQGMKMHLMTEERKQEVISEHGKDKYNDMLERLDDPDKIMHTQHTLIPNFLDQAVQQLIAKGEMSIAK
jgi:GMP synthase-like glutamine amidotransferase